VIDVESLRAAQLNYSEIPNSCLPPQLHQPLPRGLALRVTLDVRLHYIRPFCRLAA
jgi:hypothetical protein